MTRQTRRKPLQKGNKSSTLTELIVVSTDGLIISSLNLLYLLDETSSSFAEIKSGGDVKRKAKHVPRKDAILKTDLIRRRYSHFERKLLQF